MCNGSPAYSTLARLCYARIDSNEVKYWVAFSRILTIDRARISLMEGYLGSLEKAWHAGSGDLVAAGLGQRSVKSVLSRRPTGSPDVEMERLARLEIKGMVKQVAGMNYIRTYEASVEY